LGVGIKKAPAFYTGAFKRGRYREGLLSG